MTSKAKIRRFKGWAMLNERGHLLWGSMRINKADAVEFFERHNPAPEGHERMPSAVPITIIIEEDG